MVSAQFTDETLKQNCPNSRPLRILLCSEDFLPNKWGIATHVSSLARCLYSLGHKVAIITTRKGDPWWMHCLKTVKCWSFDGIPVYQISLLPPPHHRLKRFVTNLEIAARSAPFVQSLVNREHFDLVHWHIYGWTNEVSRRLKGVARVYTNHASGFLRLYASGAKSEAYYHLKWADRVIGVSKELVKKSIEVGFPAERAHCIPNGVDTEIFRPGDRYKARTELGIKTGLVIVCACRIVPVKGLIFFAQALRILAKRGFRGTVLMAGNKPLNEAREYEKEVRAKFDSLPNTIEVHWMGQVPQERMPLVYQAANVSVLSSLTENISYAILESMACCTPVIGTRVGGTPEIIEDGASGRLVPSENPERLAAALQHLLNDDEARLLMGERARQFVKNKYAWSVVAPQIIQVYRLAIEDYNARMRTHPG